MLDELLLRPVNRATGTPRLSSEAYIFASNRRIRVSYLFAGIEIGSRRRVASSCSVEARTGNKRCSRERFPCSVAKQRFDGAGHSDDCCAAEMMNNEGACWKGTIWLILTSF